MWFVACETRRSTGWARVAVRGSVGASTMTEEENSKLGSGISGTRGGEGFVEGDAYGGKGGDDHGDVGLDITEVGDSADGY